MEITVEIPEAEPVEVESFSFLVSFILPSTTRRYRGSHFYSEISVYYGCDVGFNTAVRCATSCLSSDFIEIDNLESRAQTTDVVPLATNTEYFVDSYSIACSGIISQVGVVLDNSTSCSTHNVIFSLLQRGNTVSRKVSTHNLSIDTRACPQDPTLYTNDVEIAVSGADFISVSSTTASLLYTDTNSTTTIYRRMGQLSSNAMVDLDTLSSRVNTQLLLSLRMQERGGLIYVSTSLGKPIYTLLVTFKHYSIRKTSLK